ncbi:hypothetical protein K503DRAFT_772113 [Rhizopogon vinicolor AM-OR11-026]|uniref:Uncharacterized protein n=1 Tax=Rhizopogon vinicolor AM-OR11-026 TaxID=1314800 RepID=A0A1B7MW44_9AGAM|nr:hypothetical protein K503DRAFT_772113 [Rhizopogon vinicolor AM-OR11-026]
MHFSFLAVLAALTAFVSVSACSIQYGACTDDTDCCADLVCVTHLEYGNVVGQDCDYPGK